MSNDYTRNGVPYTQGQLFAETDFQARRKTGIGGSDVAAVLGVSPWKTPAQLWADKTGNAAPVEETERMHFGHALEQVVADEFAHRRGVKVERRNNMYRHKEHPELIANIDRYVVGGAILECKTADKWSAAKWGESGTDEVPEHYLLQVTHYMYVTGIHRAFLAVLIGGNEYRDYEIEYDAKLADYAAEQCVNFWRGYVEQNICPPPMRGDNLSAYWQAVKGKSVIATDEIEAAIGRLTAVKAELAALKDRAEELSDDIKVAMADAEILLDADGKKLATWTAAKERTVTTFDADRLKAENYEIYMKYATTETKPGIRTLRLAK